MISSYDIRPNPHAVDVASLVTESTSRRTAYLPKFTVHPGWNFNGYVAGLYIRREHAVREPQDIGTKIVESVEGPFSPNLVGGRSYEYTYGQLSNYCDYDYTDAWGDRHYSHVFEMWLVLNYDGTGRVMTDDAGRVISVDGEVMVDR